MSKNWRKVVSMLGISAMLCTNVMGVMAEENAVEEQKVIEQEGEEATSGQAEEEKTEDTSAEDTSKDAEETETEETTTVEITTEEAETEEATTEEAQTEETETVEEAELAVYAADEQVEEGVPSDLGWRENGMAYFKHNIPFNEGDTIYANYYVELYRDNEMISDGWRYGISTTNSEYFLTNFCADKYYNFYQKETYVSTGIWESGVYKYRLKVREDSNTSSDFTEGKVSEFSTEFNYTKPEKTYDVPQNLRWKSKGVLTWDIVEGAEEYGIYIRTEENNSSWGTSTQANQIDLTKYFVKDNFDYRIVVNAQPSYYNRGKVIASDFSEEIIFNTKESNNETNQGIESIVGNVTQENVNDVAATLKDTYKGEEKNALQIAMQSDAKTQELIKNLDEQYASKNNITVKDASVSEDVDLDASKIKMVGAALNAPANANVQMNIKKPEPRNDIATTSPELLKDKYNHTVQFSMDVEGIDNSSDLAVPITITMPIPSGLDPQKLVILHQQSDGTLQSVKLKVNDDNTVSFTITHFSEFVFAEALPENDKPSVTPDNKSDNTSSSSSSDSNSSQSSASTSTAAKKAEPSIGNSYGWNALNKEVDAAVNKAAAAGTPATVWVALGDVEIIPASALKTFAGKDVTVMFATKSGVIVNVNGNALDVNALGNISLSSKNEKDGSISIKVRNSQPEMDKAIAVFAKAPVGTTEKTLYFVNADKSLVDFRTSSVAENGFVAFEIPFVNADFIMK